MKIVVCGGAGYIGSHLVREIRRATQYEVIIVDSLVATKGFHEHIAADISLEIGDVRDTDFLSKVFEKHSPIDAVVHMCASIVVPDSVREPLSYYDNNVIGALRIAQVMVKYGIKQLVFSSTAALFGTPEHSPIEPDDRVMPESPYGETKWIAEMMFRDCEAAHGLRTVFLRYFNACGADEDGDIGETHDPETHLIPLVLSVAQGKRDHINIYGNDYPTADGTCVRDYVHVTDLATAHIRALEYLNAGNQTEAFNLGSGQGYSVLQVIEACRRVTGHTIPAVAAPRRPGDPPTLVASSSKAKRVLGWAPRYETIDSVVETAWRFHQAHPNGYVSTPK